MAVNWIFRVSGDAMKKSNILLAISTSRYSHKLVTHAIQEAVSLQEKGHEVKIDVLYVIEEDELKKVSAQIGSQAFWGSLVKNDVVDALGEEHHRMAMQRIDEIKIAAAQSNCLADVYEVKGTFSASVIRHAEANPCDVILLTRDDRPFISRFLFGSEADRVARLARKESIGKVIIDEG